MDEIYKEKLNPTIEYFQKAITLHLSRKSRILPKISLIIAVILIIESIVLIVFSFLLQQSYFYGIFFLIIGIFGLYRYFTFVRWNSKLSLMMHNIRNKSTSFKINKEGYISLKENKKKTHLWNDFKEAIITDEIILLYKSWYKYVIFGKESYSDEEFENIKNWIRNAVEVIK